MRFHMRVLTALACGMLYVAGTGSASAAPVVALLSDYGHASTTAGLCHGVLLAALGDVDVIDLSHEVPGGDIFLGSVMLRRVGQLPPKAIVIGLVGTDSNPPPRLVAFQTTRGLVCLGPDNGLFGWVMKLQGVFRAVSIEPAKVDPDYSANDSEAWGLLCAAAAVLVKNNGNLVSIGSSLDQALLSRGDTPVAKVSPATHEVEGTILRIDPGSHQVWTSISRENLRMAGLRAGTSIELVVTADGAEPVEVPVVYASGRASVGERSSQGDSLLAEFREDLLVLMPTTAHDTEAYLKERVALRLRQTSE